MSGVGYREYTNGGVERVTGNITYINVYTCLQQCTNVFLDIARLIKLRNARAQL